MKKIVFLLAIVALAVYFNSLGHSFVWDDRLTIVNNDLITHVKYIPRIFTTDLYHSHAEKFALEHSNYYRPVQALTFLLDYHVWKLNPFGFHLTNVLLHFANSILVFVTVFFICRSRITSLFTSMFFLVHPVQTGAVNYLTGRSDILACFFLLLSFISYIGHCSIVNRGKLINREEKPDSIYNLIAKRQSLFYPISVFGFILALLSKEAVIIYPLILILYDFTFGGRVSLDKELNKLSARLRRYSAYLLVDAVYIALRLSVLNFTPGKKMFYSISGLNLQLLTMCRTFMDYIRLMVYPADLHMERDVPFASSIFEAYTALSLAGIAVLVFLMVVAYKRSRAMFFGIVWFITFLIPFSNIVPISAQMAEHWLYIPSVGFLLIAAIMLVKLQSLRVNFKYAIALFAVLISLYSWRTIVRNRDWRDDLSIYSATLKSSPKKAKMFYNIGTVYQERGDLYKALKSYYNAVDSGMEKSEVYTNIATANMRIGNRKEAERNFKIALERDPKQPFAHNGLGGLYEEAGLEDRAIAEYKKAVESYPQFYEAHVNLGILYNKRGDLRKAIYHFKEALSIRRDRSSYYNLGKAYYDAGDLEKAAAIWREGDVSLKIR